MGEEERRERENHRADAERHGRRQPVSGLEPVGDEVDEQEE